MANKRGVAVATTQLLEWIREEKLLVSKLSTSQEIFSGRASSNMGEVVHAGIPGEYHPKLKEKSLFSPFWKQVHLL